MLRVKNQSLRNGIDGDIPFALVILESLLQYLEYLCGFMKNVSATGARQTKTGDQRITVQPYSLDTQ